MNRILITGASGFVGGAAFHSFRRGGWDVVGIGRRPLADPDYLQVDLTQASCKDSIRRLGTFDVVLHCAARSSPWGSAKTFETANVQATRHIMAAASSAGQPKLIFVSSSSVYYREQDQLGINESTPQAHPAINLYAASKQRAEEHVRTYDGPWAILRPRAVYGRGDFVLFPRILAAARAERLPILYRSGAPAVGDLLSIGNLVDCFIQTASHDRIQGEFNLTDNQSVEIIPFLLGIFDRLKIPEPRRRVSVKAAFRAAWLIEKFFALCLPWKEPPITRFGVHVFAFSKTFNVQKMVDTLGPPRQTVEAAVDEFIDWVQTDAPYGKQAR